MTDFNKMISTSQSAVKAYAERLNVVTENIANEHTTGTTSEEDPYIRKVIFFKNEFDKETGAVVLRTYKDRDTKTNFNYKYNPSHPAANIDGLVKFPNVEAIIEHADALEAQKGYEANVALLSKTLQLMHKTIDIMAK